MKSSALANVRQIGMELHTGDVHVDRDYCAKVTKSLLQFYRCTTLGLGMFPIPQICMSKKVGAQWGNDITHLWTLYFISHTKTESYTMK